MSLPRQNERPDGLHLKYHIEHEDGTAVDSMAEYFVLRLDKFGDPKHVSACRKAVLTYADAIADTLPKLANDLRQRYGHYRTVGAGLEIER